MTQAPDPAPGGDQIVAAPSGPTIDTAPPGRIERLAAETVIVHGGWTVLTSDDDGDWSDGTHGLWDVDTRILSRHALTVGGRRPQLLAAWRTGSDRWQAIFHVPLPGGGKDGPRLPQDVLEVRVARRVGPGLEERIAVMNRSMATIGADLRLEFDADFADVQEAGGERRQRGSLRVRWDQAGRALLFDYRSRVRDRRLHRASRVRIAASTTPPQRIRRSLRFDLELAPAAAWTATLVVESLVDGRWRAPLVEHGGVDGRSATRRDRAAERWRERRTTVEASDPAVAAVIERASEDLLALRNWDLEGDRDDAWVPHAGVPTYTGLFGRDSLTAAWQAAMLGPELMRGAIEQVARVQATHDDPFTDAQPGRLIHEMRRGPLSELGIIPQLAYYGTQTTPAMFALVLSELWHWTGDLDVVHRNRDVALRALDWAATAGDPDADGFLESATRSSEGLENQAWKDSNEAIRMPDGRRARPPVATVEEQAFHILALERTAELLVALEDDEPADELLRRAGRIRRRWQDAYWLEDEGFYALALDGDERPVRSIASNPGHALAAGVVPPDLARRVADRLLAEDLFGGWGVRTLSSRHRSYNPFAYHLGAVWPVENATFALGFMRYGLDDHLDRIVSAMFAAAAASPFCSLPEAIAGLSHAETPIPVRYPRANRPQAWSASAVTLALQATLGLYPFAPARLLTVRPRLPHGVDVLTIHRLRVGEATVSIRFVRREDGSADHEVLEQDGSLLVLAGWAPVATDGGGSLRDGLGRWVVDHAPGRLARAFRISLGLETPDSAGTGAGIW